MTNSTIKVVLDEIRGTTEFNSTNPLTGDKIYPDPSDDVVKINHLGEEYDTFSIVTTSDKTVNIDTTGNQRYIVKSLIDNLEKFNESAILTINNIPYNWSNWGNNENSNVFFIGNRESDKPIHFG